MGTNSFNIWFDFKETVFICVGKFDLHGREFSIVIGYNLIIEIIQGSKVDKIIIFVFSTNNESDSIISCESTKICSSLGHVSARGSNESIDNFTWFNINFKVSSSINFTFNNNTKLIWVNISSSSTFDINLINTSFFTVVTKNCERILVIIELKVNDIRIPHGFSDTLPVSSFNEKGKIFTSFNFKHTLWVNVSFLYFHGKRGGSFRVSSSNNIKFPSF
jgi:hypothetical protein